MSALDLYLFTTNVPLATTAERAGVTSVIVDWERHGKARRQRGYDTEINLDTPADVRALAGALQIPVTVRVDALAGGAERDIELALDAGARVLMLPMARSAADVEQFLRLVRGRAQTLVQIETATLAASVADLQGLGWDAAYVGLNDLMISRGGEWLWEPLLDGTVDRIYDALDGRAVGFGGVTVLGGGRPLPFVHLLHEMARLSCGLSFLRRTFHREIGGREIGAEFDAVRAAWRAARGRTPAAVERDRRAFRDLLLASRPTRARAS